ncbi:Gamma-glutamyl hydrolase [Holothuria leucospilota]|uniref:folate gamma-glutamyl hydrolase n=1 Tax=Holothuria leucospilota TaxID=206669 RepID=A0A9Q1H993_HOLLE|nr:Gamma-glutamyl hydrolase [Holothuria leucospilota]
MIQGADGILPPSGCSLTWCYVLVKVLLITLAILVILPSRVSSARDNDGKLNDRPIIGVLSQESVKELMEFGPTYIPASYVKFIESGGARVVPILINQTESYYTEMFNSINGVLFPGGGVDDLLHSGYGIAGKIFYDLAIKSNKEGDYFPIWGTCQGFELIASLAAGKNILATLGANKENLNVSLTKDVAKSKLLGNAPSEVTDALRTKAVTYNYHTYSVTPDIYRKYAGLNSTYTILGTSKTDKGETFISIMEAKEYPFYAVQFHPEKPTFEWSVNTNIKHNSFAVKTGAYFSEFLVSEARKSNHTFVSPTEESSSLIYSYNVTFTGGAYDLTQCYFFDL